MQEFIFGTRDKQRAVQCMRAIRDLVNEFLRVKGRVVVVVKELSKSRAQEERYNAMIGVIAKHVPFQSEDDERPRLYDRSVWKMLLVDDYAKECEMMGQPLRKPGRYMPALDGTGRIVRERPSTTDFSTEEAANFIEYLFAKGTEYGVQWPASSDDIAFAESVYGEVA